MLPLQSTERIEWYGYHLKKTALCKSFKGQTAVNNVSPNIQRNSVYGLLGPNGAGKSTILLTTGLFAAIWSSSLFGAPFFLTGGITKVPVGFYTVIPLALWGSNILLYGVHFVLAHRFGKNLGIGFGVFGSLLAAILQTGLGPGI